jgi:hypothetical protein
LLKLLLLSYLPFSNSLLLFQNAFQERIVQRRESEFSSLRKERDERVNQLISSRKRERETVRKLMYYLNLEEQRIQRQREEDEARKREGKCILGLILLFDLLADRSIRTLVLLLVS